MKRAYCGIATNSKPLTEAQAEAWSSINGILNATGVYGFIDYNCKSTLFTVPQYYNLRYELGFKIPKHYKCNYFAGYTFGFTSCLESCHQFIQISFQGDQQEALQMIPSLLNAEGFWIEDNEVLFTIQLPAKIAGEEVWDVLFGLEHYVREATKSSVTLAGRPTYRNDKGFIRTDDRLITMPDLRGGKRRKDLVKCAKVDFASLRAFVPQNRVPYSEAQPTSSIMLAPASGVSIFSPSGEKITDSNATAGLIDPSLQSSNPRSPLQSFSSGPSPTATDHSDAVLSLGSASVDHNIRKITPYQSGEVNLGGLQPYSYPVQNMGDIYYIYLEVQLSALFKSLAGNDLRIKIGDKINRGKVIPRWMGEQDFIAAGMAWLIAIRAHPNVHKERTKQVFIQWVQHKKWDISHCFAKQSWMLNYLKQFNIITVIAHNELGKESYSTFEGRQYSKKYSMDLHILEQLALESGYNILKENQNEAPDTV